NGCANCTVTGQLDVNIHANPTVPLAEQPTLLDNTVHAAHDIVVDASASGAPTGIHVKKGQKISVDASGSFAVTGNEGATTYDANGSFALTGLDFELLLRKAYRLHRRVRHKLVRPLL